MQKYMFYDFYKTEGGEKINIGKAITKIIIIVINIKIILVTYK